MLSQGKQREKQSFLDATDQRWAVNFSKGPQDNLSRVGGLNKQGVK